MVSMLTNLSQFRNILQVQVFEIRSLQMIQAYYNVEKNALYAALAAMVSGKFILCMHYYIIVVAQ